MHGAVSYPFKITLVQLPQVLQAQPEHGNPAHAKAPREHGAFHTPRVGYLLPEDTCPAHLHPAKAVHPDLGLDRRLRIREEPGRNRTSEKPIRW